MDSTLRDLDGIPTNEELELWASRVVRYSSQYNNSGWSAQSILGCPRVYPRYGDIQGAWAQGATDNTQYIEVEFAKALYVDSINIYETLNGGAVVRVKALAPSQTYATLWQSTTGASVVSEARIFTPPIDTPDFPVKVVRLELDCSAAGSWCELDAVHLVGKQSRIEPPPSMKKLSGHLHSLVDSLEHSDVTFDVCGHVVHAHKAVLSARSHYFRAMFGSGMKETTGNEPISIEGVGHQAFLGLLQYFYTNTLGCEITPSDMLQLIRVGDRFSAEGLDKLCFWFLSHDLTVDNVISLYRSSMEDIPPLENIHNLCLNFIVHHMGALSKRDDFSKLSQPQMLEIIQHSTAKISV